MRLLLIAPALLLATAAGAQQADMQAKPDAPAEKPVCRREAAATGSHMPGKRVCHTAAEWAAIARAASSSRVIMGTGSAPPQVEMMNVGNQR